jgi:deoxyribose-phosphate aldolase
MTLSPNLKLPAVDAAGIEARAAFFTTRSIKKDAKVEGLKAVVAMMDLTTLSGADTAGKVESLCARALRPMPGRDDVGPVAAVCVHEPWVPLALRLLAGSAVKVAAVATYFPAGQAPTAARVEETRRIVEAGAHEIDMVIRRGDMLAGHYQACFDDIAAVKEACGQARLKVILETGELGSYERVRLASDLALAAGADFIKTSTGKVQPAATLPVTLVMLQAIADHHRQTGRMAGMKPAGGIRTAKQALHWLVMLHDVLGPAWMTPCWFRFGASSLLGDLVLQLEKEARGHYVSPERFGSLGTY